MIIRLEAGAQDFFGFLRVFLFFFMRFDTQAHGPTEIVRTLVFGEALFETLRNSSGDGVGVLDSIYFSE